MLHKRVFIKSITQIPKTSKFDFLCQSYTKILNKIYEQAGAHLCQAQFMLGLVKPSVAL